MAELVSAIREHRYWGRSWIADTPRFALRPAMT
jgi:hypothetical protein